ncbi:MAG: hypothetical protein EA424_23165, partial [Planctomycetaceae bacterium]
MGKKRRPTGSGVVFGQQRTLLKGLGSVTIGLLLLEEVLVSPAAAASETVPVRAFNVFFGLGIPAPLQTEGF